MFICFSLRYFIESCILNTSCLFYFTIIMLSKKRKIKREKKRENDRYRKLGTKIYSVAFEEVSRSPTQLFLWLESPEHSPATHILTS